MPTSEEYIEKLTPYMQGKVEAILGDLKGKGHKARVFSSLRTVDEQRRLVAIGRSKTMHSFHLPGSDGKARAADIAEDDSTPWIATKRFWLVLASSAWARRVGWGGLFGLNWLQRRALKAAIEQLRKEGWPQVHPLYERTIIGWDPGHVQIESNW